MLRFIKQSLYCYKYIKVKRDTIDHFEIVLEFFFKKLIFMNDDIICICAANEILCEACTHYICILKHDITNS
jgi:hypothetical protein